MRNQTCTWFGYQYVERLLRSTNGRVSTCHDESVNPGYVTLVSNREDFLAASWSSGNASCKSKPRMYECCLPNVGFVSLLTIWGNVADSRLRFSAAGNQDNWRTTTENLQGWKRCKVGATCKSWIRFVHLLGMKNLLILVLCVFDSKEKLGLAVPAAPFGQNDSVFLLRNSECHLTIWPKGYYYNGVADTVVRSPWKWMMLRSSSLRS